MNRFETEREFPCYTSDAAAGLYYVRVAPGRISRTVGGDHGVFVDVDENGRVLGVEIIARAQGGWTEVFECATDTEEVSGPIRVWLGADPE